MPSHPSVVTSMIVISSAWLPRRPSPPVPVTKTVSPSTSVVPHPRTSILFSGSEAYTVLGTLVQIKHGRVIYASDARGEQVAIKVIRKTKHWEEPIRRVYTATEHAVSRRVAELGMPFLVPLRSSWEDDYNVYLVMVRTRRGSCQPS